MDLTPLLPSIPALMEDVEEVLKGHSIVACLEHMKWLGAFACIPSVQKHLVAACTTEAEAFAHIQENQPSLLIVSQHLEQGTGLSLVARTEQLNREIKTLLVCDDDDSTLVKEALARGCDGLCFRSERFIPALTVVARGGVYYPEPVPAVLKDSLKSIEPVDRLSEREREVLFHTMLGRANREISEQLIISEETVKSHTKSIMSKLQVGNRTQAVVKALAIGLVSVEDIGHAILG